MRSSVLLVPLLASAMLFSACNQTVTDYGVLMGTVSEPLGIGVGDVTITLGEASTTTNGQGFFVLTELAEVERGVVTFEKNGYVATTEIAHIRLGQSNWLEIVMTPHDTPTAVDNSTGGTVTNAAGASVTLPVNFARDSAGEAWVGAVDVALTVLDPSTDLGLATFPGDFRGTPVADTELLLRSYGYLDVRFLDPSTGAELDPTPGALFDVSVPVPASMQVSAPAAPTLWSVDETNGYWFAAATAAFDGTHCTATVSTLSDLNCAVSVDRAYLTGRVVDCDRDGSPVVAGARVTGQGAGWLSTDSSTNETGAFRIPVAANEAGMIWPAKHGVRGSAVSFTSLDAGATLQLDDLCLDVPPLIFALVWNGEPRDLDSHLSVPTDPREHLYFANSQVSVADLDTDDVDGYGPEIVTVYDLPRGNWRYSVHHYAGASDMTEGGATALMLIEGQGIRVETPPRGGQAVNDVWQVWDFGVRKDEVKGIRAVRRIVESSGSTDMSAFDPTSSSSIDTDSPISSDPTDYGF